MNRFVNFLLFQAGWFACVLLGRTEWYLAGPLIVAGIVLYHLKTAHDPQAEGKLLTAALVIGLVWENLLTFSGLLTYPTAQFYGVLAPVWIIVMWPLLAITLNQSLRWMKGRPMLAVLFGAIGGPMAFLAGEKLGAVTFNTSVMTLTVLAIGWAVLFPLLMKLAERHDGFAIVIPRPLEQSA